MFVSFFFCLNFKIKFIFVQEENLEINTSTIQDPHFGILTVDTFDDQQQPIIPLYHDYSVKFWFRIKRMFLILIIKMYLLNFVR